MDGQTDSPGRVVARWINKKWNPQVVGVVVLIYITFIYTTSMQMVGRPRSGARGQAKIVMKSVNDSMLIAEFGRRKKVIKDTCEKHGAYTTKDKVVARMKLKPGPELSPGVEKDDELWNLLKKTSHHQFFVQREHGLMWCKVPKAASTSWLHAFLKLAHVSDNEIPEDNSMGLHAFLRDKYPLLAKNLNKQMMPVSLKFLVVRHPFERVMSAYIDKIEDYKRDLKYRGGYYYAMYGADIVGRYRHQYREKFPDHPLFQRKEPSFPEFVSYLLETPITKYDEHWRPIFLLCPPCHFKFDVIVKMETFNRDTQFILNQRDLSGLSLHKKHSSKSQKENDLTKRLFSQISKKMVKALQEKFRVDFEMFEYDSGEFLRYASESVNMIPDTMPQVHFLDDRAEKKESDKDVKDESNVINIKELESSNDNIKEPIGVEKQNDNMETSPKTNLMEFKTDGG